MNSSYTPSYNFTENEFIQAGDLPTYPATPQQAINSSGIHPYNAGNEPIQVGTLPAHPAVSQQAINSSGIYQYNGGNEPIQARVLHAYLAVTQQEINPSGIYQYNAGNGPIQVGALPAYPAVSQQVINSSGVYPYNAGHENNGQSLTTFGEVPIDPGLLDHQSTAMPTHMGGPGQRFYEQQNVAAPIGGDGRWNQTKPPDHMAMNYMDSGTLVTQNNGDRPRPPSSGLASVKGDIFTQPSKAVRSIPIPREDAAPGQAINPAMYTLAPVHELSREYLSVAPNEMCGESSSLKECNRSDSGLGSSPLRGHSPRVKYNVKQGNLAMTSSGSLSDNAASRTVNSIDILMAVNIVEAVSLMGAGVKRFEVQMSGPKLKKRCREVVARMAACLERVNNIDMDILGELNTKTELSNQLYFLDKQVSEYRGNPLSCTSLRMVKNRTSELAAQEAARRKLETEHKLQCTKIFDKLDELMETFEAAI